MGKCSVTMHRKLIANILLNYSDQVKILKTSLFEDDDIYYVELESKKLPDGYHGHMEVYVDLYDVKFKSERDV
jgi:hypothetical protein